MLSRSTRIACSNASVLKGCSQLIFSRSQTTQTLNNTNASPNDSIQKKQNNYASNPLTVKLESISKAEFSEFFPMFEEIQNAFESLPSHANRTSPRGLNRIGNSLLNKILAIKKSNKINVQTSTLFKELITILADSETLHVSHFNRYIESLLIDGRYMEALTVWVHNAGYFKDTPAAMFSANPKFSPVQHYHLCGLSSYLLSLIENKETTIDPEFIKLIYGDQKAESLYRLSKFLRNLNLPEADLNYVLPLYSDFKAKSFDINSPESLKGVRVAAVDGKIVYLETTIDQNLKVYENKANEIKPSTIAFYMKYLNHAKLYSKCIDIWKFAAKNKIQLDVEIWNQLLKAFASIKINDSAQKIDSVWKLLNDSCIPNSESYSTYIQYLIKSRRNDKAKEMITQIRTNTPELFDSSLKCSLIQFLSASKKVEEAYDLFNIYAKDESFTPNIETYNILFTGLVNESKLTEANNLLENLVAKKYSGIAPDIATWTKIIDLLMKNAREAKLSRASIVEKLSQIIEDMISQKIEFNSATLSVVAVNLLRNYKTQDLGLQILKKIEGTGVKLNEVAYSGIITSFTQKGDLPNALFYFDKALLNGIKPSAALYNSILKGYSLNPDVPKTLEFLDRIEKIQSENPNNFRLLPNKYTFFFLLSQAISVKDTDFVKVILEKLSHADIDLGTELPTILKSLRSNGYEIPASLEAKIAN